MQGVVRPEVKTAIREMLARRPGRARFVVEIAASLAESPQNMDAEPEEFERALTELERNGSILVRDNACADPHLEGADLRLAALIEASSDCSDSQGAAVIAIEAAWNRWLADYLASHRCT